MISKWRQSDNKPYIGLEEFQQQLPDAARVWGAKRFKHLVPWQQPGADPLLNPVDGNSNPATTQQPVPTGAAAAQAIFQLDSNAIQILLNRHSAQNGTSANPIVIDNDTTGDLKISMAERKRMHIMCGNPPGSSDEAFPKWFRDLFDKNKTAVDKKRDIANAVESTFIFEDAKVMLHPQLAENIMKRAWTGNDVCYRPTYSTCAQGLSPFRMHDLTEEDIAFMYQLQDDLDRASSSTTSDIRKAREKLAAKTPPTDEKFMTVMKSLCNLLYSLFTSQCPMYKALYPITNHLRMENSASRLAMTMRTRAHIMWIILLQTRRFSWGKMIAGSDNAFLGAFTNMHVQIMANSFETIYYSGVPAQLLVWRTPNPNSNKRDREEETDGNFLGTGGGGGGGTGGGGGGGTGGGGGGDKNKRRRVKEKYSEEMKKVIHQAWKDAGEPGIGKICAYCNVSPLTLLPGCDNDNDCRQFLILGKCQHKERCKYNHLTATAEQVKAVETKLARFISEPLGCKSGKKTN